MILELGFQELERSSNPVYYILPIKVKNPSLFFDKPKVIIGLKGDQWSLRGECDDYYPSFVSDLDTMQQVVSAIAEQAYYFGSMDKGLEIRKALSG